MTVRFGRFAPMSIGIVAACVLVVAAGNRVPPAATAAGLDPTPLPVASPALLVFTPRDAAVGQRLLVRSAATGVTATPVDPSICSVVMLSDASVGPSTHAFIVSALAPGTTTIVVNAADGETIAAVPVTVIGRAIAASIATPTPPAVPVIRSLPSPSSVPVPAATTANPLTVGPNAFSLVIGTPLTTAFFDATERGFRGRFRAVSADPKVAVVTPGVGPGESASFEIIATGTGATVVHVTDGKGQTVSIAVTVR